MFGIWAAPCANQTLGTCNLAIGIGREFQIATCGIVDRGLVDIHQVPVRTAQLIALKLQGRLSEHHTDGVLAEDLVVGQGVFNLPGSVITLIRGSRSMVGIVVTREIVLLFGRCIVAPERELGTVGEVISEFIEQLQVERELRHELVAPVSRGVALHHGDGVVLLLIAAHITGNRIRIAVGIVVEIVGTVAVDHGLSITGGAIILVA